VFFLERVWFSGMEDRDQIIGEYEHDPELEPYASMSREAVYELMDQAAIDCDYRQFYMLASFFKDKMTCHEFIRDIAASERTNEIMESSGSKDAVKLMHVANMSFVFVSTVEGGE
jgi:hypothetical protein